MRRKVIFIASCGHSGSTVLELLLTTNPKSVGIGEAFQLVDPRNPIIHTVEKYKCGCGAYIHECDLWGPVIRELRSTEKCTAEEKYGKILRHVYDKYEEGIIVDSSKVVKALEVLNAISTIELKVVHIIRDVRAYLFSMRSKKDKVNSLPPAGEGIRRFRFREVHRLVRRNRFYIYQDWYRTNKKSRFRVCCG